MSTSYGYAIVQFPGFKPALFETIDGRIRVAYRRGPSRQLQCVGHRTVRLSLKERRRLRSFAKKWNKRRGFRTFYRLDDC
jgi:hypothetical protein